MLKQDKAIVVGLRTNIDSLPARTIIPLLSKEAAVSFGEANRPPHGQDEWMPIGFLRRTTATR
jgi:hypothetical protein